VVADGRDHAEHHVVEVARFEAWQPLPEFAEEPDDEVDWLGGVRWPCLGSASRMCGSRSYW
jgi:hypothetical protein